MMTWRGRPWAAVTCRKGRRRVRCGSRILSGQVAYRPLREGPRVARSDRLCHGCGLAHGDHLA